MVRSVQTRVTVTSIATRFEGMGIYPSKSYVPFDTYLIDRLLNAETGEGINDQYVAVWRLNPDEKIWQKVATMRSHTHEGRAGTVHTTQRIPTYGTYQFHFIYEGRPPYSGCGSLYPKVEGVRRPTLLAIGASPSNPVPMEPFTIYGELIQLAPEEKRINGKQVVCYESPDDGATWTEVGRQKTHTIRDYDGCYSFEFKKGDGNFLYYVEFEGDVTHEGCAEKLGGLSYGPVYF